MLWTNACKDLLEGLDWLSDVRQLGDADRQAAYDAALPYFRRALASIGSLTEPTNPQANHFRITHQQLTALLEPALRRDSAFGAWMPRRIREIALNAHADRRDFEQLTHARTA
jgi:hypothetical protein